MDLTKKVAAIYSQIALSALMESESEWQQFKEVPMAANKKIAYVNATHGSFIPFHSLNKAIRSEP